VDFDDPEKVFASKTTGNLLRSWAILKACRVKPLVCNAEALLGVSRALIGRRATDKAVEATFFKHFCAGEAIFAFQAPLAIKRPFRGGRCNTGHIVVSVTKPSRKVGKGGWQSYHWGGWVCGGGVCVLTCPDRNPPQKSIVAPHPNTPPPTSCKSSTPPPRCRLSAPPPPTPSLQGLRENVRSQELALSARP